MPAAVRGADRVCGGQGKDSLVGGSGQDRLVGGGDADRVWGYGGGDRLDGGGGDDRLYGASDRQLRDVLRTLPDATRTVLVIGHNPGLEDLVDMLTGVQSPLKTSSIAVLSSRFGWAEAGVRWARLDSTVTPRS